MRSVSRLAISRLALAVAGFALAGTAAMTATPALAQKKKAEKAASGEYSKEFRAAAGPAQEAMQKAQALNDEAKKLQAAGNAAAANAKKEEAKAAYLAAKPGVEALAPLAKSADEQVLVGEYQLQIAAFSDDQKGQQAALERILASGKANPASLGAYNYFAGAFAYQDKNYPKAIEYLAAAKQHGNKDADAMLVDAYLQGGQVDQGLKMAREAIAARQASGQAMTDDLFTRPALALQKANRKPEMMEFVLGRVQYFPTAEYWGNAIDMVVQQSPTVDAKLDLLRLKSTAGLMRDEYDYTTYSYLAAEEGLPAESLAAITEARAKAKLGAAAVTELRDREAKQKARLATDTKASLSGSETAARSAANGRIAKSTGDAWLNHNEFAKAAAMYQLSLEKGGVDANLLNTRIGIALAKQGDKAGAKAAFAKVTGPRANIAKLWTIYLDSGVKG